jgi:hypothetical protein
VIKAQAIHIPTPTLSNLGKQTEQQAACMSSQSKATEPEVPVVKTQPPHSKHSDSRPLRRVGHLSRGQLIFLRTLLLRPA